MSQRARSATERTSTLLAEVLKRRSRNPLNVSAEDLVERLTSFDSPKAVVDYRQAQLPTEILNLAPPNNQNRADHFYTAVVRHLSRGFQIREIPPPIESKS